MTSTETKRAAAIRRRVLAGLRLSSVLHRLGAGTATTTQPDRCANQCGALDFQAREAWSRRGSCPCREAS